MVDPIEFAMDDSCPSRMIREIDSLIEKPADAMLLSTAGPGYTDGVDEDPAVSLHSGPIEIKRIGGKVC